VSLDFEELFVVVPQWILFADRDRETSGLSDKAVRLYAVLQSWASNESHQATPSRTTLAKALGCHPKTIDRAIEDLVEFGALTKTRRRDDAGDWTSNEYLLRTRPEETLWTSVSRGRDTHVPTVGTPVSLRVGTPVSNELDPIELDPTNYGEADRNVAVDPKHLLDAWAAKTSTPLTKPLRRKWYPLAVEFVAAAPDELLERVDSFLDYCVREGCRSPAGWASFAAGYSRALRLAGVNGPALAAIEPTEDGEPVDPSEVRAVLGMRDGESGREFLERTAREATG